MPRLRATSILILSFYALAYVAGGNLHQFYHLFAKDDHQSVHIEFAPVNHQAAVQNNEHEHDFCCFLKHLSATTQSAAPFLLKPVSISLIQHTTTLPSPPTWTHRGTNYFSPQQARAPPLLV